MLESAPDSMSTVLYDSFTPHALARKVRELLDAV